MKWSSPFVTYEAVHRLARPSKSTGWQMKLTAGSHSGEGSEGVNDGQGSGLFCAVAGLVALVGPLACLSCSIFVASCLGVWRNLTNSLNSYAQNHPKIAIVGGKRGIHLHQQ